MMMRANELYRTGKAWLADLAICSLQAIVQAHDCSRLSRERTCSFQQHRKSRPTAGMHDDVNAEAAVGRVNQQSRCDRPAVAEACRDVAKTTMGSGFVFHCTAAPRAQICTGYSHLHEVRHSKSGSLHTAARQYQSSTVWRRKAGAL